MSTDLVPTVADCQTLAPYNKQQVARLKAEKKALKKQIAQLEAEAEAKARVSKSVPKKRAQRTPDQRARDSKRKVDKRSNRAHDLGNMRNRVACKFRKVGKVATRTEIDNTFAMLKEAFPTKFTTKTCLEESLKLTQDEVMIGCSVYRPQVVHTSKGPELVQRPVYAHKDIIVEIGQEADKTPFHRFLADELEGVLRSADKKWVDVNILNGKIDEICRTFREKYSKALPDVDRSSLRIHDEDARHGILFRWEICRFPFRVCQGGQEGSPYSSTRFRCHSRGKRIRDSRSCFFLFFVLFFFFIISLLRDFTCRASFAEPRARRSRNEDHACPRRCAFACCHSRSLFFCSSTR